tara:strand:+ start:197 stop:391 length:195 start_codon:yes stop_codon:yes gene_type:complete
MSIVSAKYLYAEDGTTKTCIQLNSGTNDAGHTTYRHIPIDTNRDSYKEIMDMVEAGELTIADAD